MNCEQARELAALAVSGDVTPMEQRSLETHIAGCPECRAEARGLAEIYGQLTEMRGESVPAPVYGAVRTRVVAEIQSRRSGWLAAWPAFAAVLACTLILVVVFHPEAPVAVQPAPYAVSNAPDVADPVPVPVTPPAAVVRRPVARAKTRESAAEPLVVHLFTDDPDVVIYWIADGKRDGAENAARQRRD